LRYQRFLRSICKIEPGQNLDLTDPDDPVVEEDGEVVREPEPSGGDSETDRGFEPEDDESGVSSGDSDSGDDSTVVTVVGDPGSEEGLTTVGRGDTIEESERDAALNEDFDADEGTDIDGIEEDLGTDQPDINPDDSESSSKSVVVTDNQKGQQETVAVAQTDQGAKVQAAANQGFDAAEGTQIDALETDLGFGQGDGTPFQDTDNRQPSSGTESRRRSDNVFEDNLQDAIRLQAQESRTTRNRSEFDVEQPQAQFTPNNPLGNQTGLFTPVDFNVGQDASQTENRVERATGNEQFAESVATAQAGGTAFVQGFANIPSGVENVLTNPRGSAEAFVTSTSRTVDRLGEKDFRLETPRDFRKQAREDSLLLSALTAPLFGAGLASQFGRTVGNVNVPNTQVSGVTDSAGVLTSLKRGSGVDDATRAGRKTIDIVDEKVTPSDLQQDPAFQVPEGFGSKPDPETSTSTQTSANQPDTFFGEDFEPPTTSFKDIAKGNTPRKVGERRQVLDPEQIEGVDPLTLTPEGGTRDVTPTQSRTEAVKTRLERRKRSDRQTAQFEQQDLLPEETTLNDILGNTRKGQLGAGGGGSLKVVQKEKPSDVDTGDTVDTDKLVSQDDRRSEFLDTGTSRRKDRIEDDFLDRRPRDRNSDKPRKDSDSSLGNLGRNSLFSNSLGDTRQSQDFNTLPDQSDRQKQPQKPETDQPRIFEDSDPQGGRPHTQTPEEFVDPNKKIISDSDVSTPRTSDSDLVDNEDEDDNDNGFNLFTQETKDTQFQASVGAEILGIRAEEKPGRAQASDPTNLRPIVSDEVSSKDEKSIF